MENGKVYKTDLKKNGLYYLLLKINFPLYSYAHITGQWAIYFHFAVKKNKNENILSILVTFIGFRTFF